MYLKSRQLKCQLFSRLEKKQLEIRIIYLMIIKDYKSEKLQKILKKVVDNKKS